MTYRPLLLATAISLLATSALAAPVFMLQFGSFETRDEATNHLNSMKSKHAGVVGSLSSTIREVTLPPDNLTVYRTQAGPLTSKSEAQSMCAKLTTTGDQCYVVETAMSDVGAVPVTKAVPIDPVASTPGTPVAGTEPAPARSTSPWAAPIVTSQSSAQRSMEPSARDAQSVSMIDSVMRTSPTEPSPGFRQMPKQEPIVTSSAPLVDDRAMDTALDDAAARQSSQPVSAAAPAPAKAAPKEERSFWSRMNPWSEGEAEKTAAAAKAAPAPATADAIQAAAPTPPAIIYSEPIPATTLAAASSTSLPSPSLVTGPEPVAAAPSAPLPHYPVDSKPVTPMVMAAAAPAAAPPMPAPVDVPSIPMASPGSSLPLPPPPAPLRAKDRDALAAGAVPESAPRAMPGTMPQSTGSLSPSAPVVISAPLPPARPAMPFQQGPSTSGTETPIAQPSVPVAVAPQAFMTMPMVPSAGTGQKTLWAQIGEFNDAQAALSFWDSYRRAHPDFPVVRVRVTSPYQAQLRGLNAVSLRVGPFARMDSVDNLCTTMPASKLNCSGVTDLGVAADPSAPQAEMLPGSRYQR